jgi:signal peptidase II
MPMTRILIAAVAVFLLDQSSKWAVVVGLDLRNRLSIDVFPPFLNFRMAWNEGVNFGLFSNDTEVTRWILVALALVISGLLLWWGRRLSGWRGAILIGLVVGGALGNVADRIMYGAVADFLNMSCCGIRNPYAFNVADIAIFIGAAGLLLFGDKLQNKA